MKALIFAALIQLCLGLAVAVETCRSEAKNVESACDYPKSLTLVSTPKKYLVNDKNCNEKYKKLDWKEEPVITFSQANPDKSYTLVNIDPDPPTYKKGQYYLHWLVANIKGSDFVKGDLSKANHLTPYYGPNPPSGSGAHRYMFLAFEENEPNSNLENPESRSNFELVTFLQKNKHLCGPVAGVQFRTEF